MAHRAQAAAVVRGVNAESRLRVTETGVLRSGTLEVGFGLGVVRPISESILKTGLGSDVEEAVTGTGLQGSVWPGAENRLSPRDILARSAGGRSGTAGGRGERYG